MASSSNSASGKSPSAAPDQIVALARKAVKSLSEKREGRIALCDAECAAAAESLCRAAVEVDGDAADTVLAELAARGIGADDIAGRIIPHAARRLGEMWMEDEVTFPEVSMAAARMQAMIRDLFDEGATTQPDAPRVVLIVSVAETHTLGAIVVTGMMRRLGVQVDLCLGRPAAEIRAMLAGSDMDLIMISAASLEALPETGRVLRMIREDLRLDVPLVVGGPVLDYTRDGHGLELAIW
ncbi:MAG: cobalamin-dependent protein [Rhodobacteraceae bacterium]|nr:cobalamin-dependent protein [Paracoccaceae bacterium]